MITAEEARNKMPKYELKNTLQTIEEMIDEAARKNFSSVKITNLFKEDNEILYSGAWKDVSQLLQDVKKTLESNGFKVEHYYKELQFVDMGIVVKWD